MKHSPLVDSVQCRIIAIPETRTSNAFSPALLEAIRLADMFESVKPEAYILPLDALAGFVHKVD
ncbi:MAG: hypothetical protein K2X09_02295 [Rickettsiales bacterium]|nr:hypothetical protein [Rickettsiales bacterium]